MTRKNFLQTLSGAAAATWIESQGVAQTGKPKFQRGVTLYSYQEELYTRAMTLEECLAEMASMKAYGLEIVVEALMADYPAPSDQWVEQWHALIQKYHMTPACMDTFIDSDEGGHRNMSPQECAQNMRTQLKLANRLGFKVMRPIMGSMPITGPMRGEAPEWLESTLPEAEKNDVRIVFEMHAPMPWTGKFVDSYLEIINRTKTKHLGFNPDMGALARRLPRVALDRALRNGVSQSVVRYLDQAFLDGVPPDRRVAEVQKMSRNPVDIGCAFSTYPYGPITNQAKDLIPLMPYIYNVHGKFYEMTEDLQEYSIPYGPVFQVLTEGGYAGFVNSEYEGQQATQDIREMDSCEQIRRHHVMMSRLMGEI